jgi:hypothetical protein
MALVGNLSSRLRGTHIESKLKESLNQFCADLKDAPAGFATK